MDDRPILTFDTSAINRLSDDCDSRVLIASLTAAFHIRLTFTSISEIIATKEAARRGKLVNLCRQLLAAGDCIDPQHALLKKLIRAYEESSIFHWQLVDVRLHEAMEGLSAEENLTEEVSGQTRKENKEIKDKFESFYAHVKPNYDKRFAEGGATRPTIFSDSIIRLKAQSTFVTMAKALYEGDAKEPTTDAIVQKFIEECPPFHTLMVALCETVFVLHQSVERLVHRSRCRHPYGRMSSVLQLLCDCGQRPTEVFSRGRILPAAGSLRTIVPRIAAATVSSQPVGNIGTGYTSAHSVSVAG